VNLEEESPEEKDKGGKAIEKCEEEEF